MHDAYRFVPPDESDCGAAVACALLLLEKYESWNNFYLVVVDECISAVWRIFDADHCYYSLFRHFNNGTFYRWFDWDLMKCRINWCDTRYTLFTIREINEPNDFESMRRLSCIAFNQMFHNVPYHSNGRVIIVETVRCIHFLGINVLSNGIDSHTTISHFIFCFRDKASAEI